MMNRKSPTVPAEAGARTRTNIPHAKSMLELNVIHDMVQFGEEMDALQANDDENNALQYPCDSDDDDGFFMDSSDRYSNDDVQGLEFSSLSVSPDSVIDVTEPANPKPQSGGMRRVMSVASLSTAHNFYPLLAAKQSIHTISEEGEDPSSNISSMAASKKSDPINTKNRRSDSIGNSDHTDPSPTGDNGVQIRIGNSRSSRHKTTSSGMPKRSSMKGSSNSLSSMSMRSSLKGSTNNLQSLDDTCHSGESDVTSSIKRNVSFSSLEIRSYKVTLGDAAGTSGPAVSLDWQYDPSATEEYDFDDYETHRKMNPPRNRAQMFMPLNHREYLLMREAGISRYEINIAMDQAKRVAKQREKTIKGLRFQPMEEVLEKAKRSFSFSRKSGS